LNQSGWLHHICDPAIRLPREVGVQVFHLVNIMTQVIHVEYGARRLIYFAQDDPLLLDSAHIMIDYCLGLEHGFPYKVRLLVSDHPGRSELRAIPDVDLSVFFNGILSAQSLSIHCEPAIRATDHSNRWWWHLHPRGVESLLPAPGLRPFDSQVVRCAKLNEFVPVHNR
jgi:hypothetical protein